MKLMLSELMSGESVHILSFNVCSSYHPSYRNQSLSVVSLSSRLFSLLISYYTALFFFLSLLPEEIGNSQWHLRSHGSHAFVCKNCHYVRERGGKIKKKTVNRVHIWNEFLPFFSLLSSWRHFWMISSASDESLPMKSDVMTNDLRVFSGDRFR